MTGRCGTHSWTPRAARLTGTWIHSTELDGNTEPDLRDVMQMQNQLGSAKGDTSTDLSNTWAERPEQSLACSGPVLLSVKREKSYYLPGFLMAIR